MTFRNHHCSHKHICVGLDKVCLFMALYNAQYFDLLGFFCTKLQNGLVTESSIVVK